MHCLSGMLVFGPNLEPLIEREKENIGTEVWRQGGKGVPGYDAKVGIVEIDVHSSPPAAGNAQTLLCQWRRRGCPQG